MSNESKPLIADNLPIIAALAKYLDKSIVIVDVGCRWGFADAWSILGSSATLIGFDPDAAECERLKNSYQGPCNIQFVDRGLGPYPCKKTLFLTKEPACSSLYEPDSSLINFIPLLAGVELVEEIEIELTTLDSWFSSSGINHVDFIKLDTQGSELGILEGGETCLSSVRALQIEVEFNPIYVGQPLFGDIDAFLRKRGFVLWRLTDLCHYSHSPKKSAFKYKDVQFFDGRAVPISAQGGQLFWGEAYYVRKEIAFMEDIQHWQGYLRDANIMSVLGFHDLASSLLQKALNHAPLNVVS